MLVLVTGANGHIGSNLVRELIAKGDKVRALVRAKSDLRGLHGLDIERMTGDVLDADSLTAAVAGVDLVYHTAAVYTMWAKDPQQIIRPAVEGAKNVFAAAGKAGVKRIVYTSSVAAVGASSSPDKLLDEKDWNTDYKNPYYEAKTESEKIAHDLAKQHGVELVVICPAMVVGPLDYRITPSTGFVRDLLIGRMPLWPGGYNYVAVGDVAKAHVLAAERGVPGERYLAASDNRTMADAAEALRKLTGHGSTRHMPPWFLYGAAALSGVLASVTGGRPLVDRDTLDETVNKWAFFDNAKAKSALGWQPRPYEETLRDTVRWLIARKELPDDINAELKGRFAPDPDWAS